jgi:multidrug efflux pump
MLCTRLLKPHQAHGWFFRATEPVFQNMERGYGNGLKGFLKHRKWAIVILFGALGLAYLFLSLLPRELSPLEDRSRIWVRATAAEGASYDYMQNFMDDVARATRERVPEADVMMTQVPGSGGAPGVQGAVNNGFVRVFLKERGERGRSQQDISEDLRFLQKKYTGANINIGQEPSIGARRSQSTGVQFVIQGSGLEALREVLPNFLDEARKSPVFNFVDSDMKFSKPEVQISIDREKAQTLGVSTLDISQTLQAALGGQRISYFILNGKQYDVIGQLTRDFRSRPSDLDNISVRTSSGELVKINNLVSLKETSSPPELYRYNRNSAAVISGTLSKGRTLDEGIAEFEEIAKRTLDDRYSTALTGTAREYVDSSSSLMWVFILALVLIYLVLAAQFESFLSPFVILLTVPLALFGALLSLWYFSQSLNIFSQIGLIMLVGLITKNGILIVEFANQRFAAGAPSRLVAVEQAAAARLRPILMTTMATVLGILPIALALGAGSESRVSMGIAVIGGLVFGSMLTLYVIPAMYVLLHKKINVVKAPVDVVVPPPPAMGAHAGDATT